MIQSWGLISHIKYSLDGPGARKKEHSEVSFAIPLANVVVLKENHVLDGAATTTSIKVCRHHEGAMNPRQLSLHTMALVPPSGT